tara:strand:+ start:2137 stop:3516 length:1380 start_codon:yes stop_codon:yes gene_type:complete
MSVFSTSLQTAIIDPQFHSESRCEFRIENRGQAYMPTLRIGNIGLAKTAGTNPNAYHFGGGTSSVISRIRLMDGNEELDSLRNVAQWLTFKGALKTNSQNTNVFNHLNGNQQGWVYGATGELLEARPEKQVRTGEDVTTGLLDLRECFGFLNNVSHLSTKLFKNLRVVIEYVPNTMQNAHLLVDLQIAANIAGLKKNIPILIVDEITDMALVNTLEKQLTGASWVAIEHDLANIPAVPGLAAVADEAVQRSQLRINGFQDKAVSRLMIAKCYEATGPGGPNVNQAGGLAGTIHQVKALGGYGSKALYKEKVNLRLNGRNVLSGDGLVTPAQQTMMLSDTWGALNMCPFQNQQSVGRDTAYANSALNVVGINQTQPPVRSTAAGAAAAVQQGYWISNSAWIGLPVQDRVTDMQIDLERTGTFSEGTQSSAGNFQALNLHVFGEVAKGMTVSGGNYRIFYA